jgi:hypothetical protein
MSEVQRKKLLLQPFFLFFFSISGKCGGRSNGCYSRCISKRAKSDKIFSNEVESRPIFTGLLFRWYSLACFSFSLHSHIFLCIAGPGTTPNDYKVLSRPLNNKLYFAGNIFQVLVFLVLKMFLNLGEHTNSTHMSTIHGAWASGLRAAREISSSRKSALFMPLSTYMLCTVFYMYFM